MHVLVRRETLVLLLGDILCSIAGLWLALWVRFGSIPSATMFGDHLLPFSLLFLFSLISFFIAGLYDKHTTVFKRHLPQRVLNAQLSNIVFAVMLFYIIPLFKIAPKTILALYLVFASVLIIAWRLYVREKMGLTTRIPAILLGVGEEVEELKVEVNGNSRYRIRFEDTINVDASSQQDAADRLRAFLRTTHQPSLVIADVHNSRCEPLLNDLYEHLPSGVTLLDFNAVYEDVFDRMSLTNFNPTLFLVAVSSPSYLMYTWIKRAMDIILSSVLLIMGACLYPFLWLLIKIDDRGPVFILQTRIGLFGRPFVVHKLRTMQAHETERGAWIGETKNRVTRVGTILRRTSLDEIPQIFNVFSGDMSLIGPRADVEGLAERLAAAIPHYMLRYHIKPGISGWAQIRQMYKKGNFQPQSVEESRLRLAYDLYYVKYRSVWLDVKITVRTIPIILSRLRP